MSFKTILCLLLSALTLLGQDNSIITDRPDQTESAFIVGMKEVQIEAGFTIEDNHDLDDVTSLLVRYGVHNDIELRLASNVTFSSPAFKYLSVGSKIKLFNRNNFVSDLAVIASLDLPYGDEDEILPSVVIAGSNNLNNQISIGYNAGVKTNFDEIIVLTSIAAGTEISEDLGVFVELFGGPYPAELKLDSGITYLLKNNLQFDCAVGYDLDSDLPEWFATTGISMRFPN